MPFEYGQHAVSAVEISQKVGFDDLIHRLPGHIFQLAGRHHAGIIDPDIDSSVELQRLLGKMLYLFSIRNIGGNRQRNGIYIVANGNRFIQPFLTAGSENQPASFQSECFCRGTTYTAGCTGDDYGFSFQRPVPRCYFIFFLWLVVSIFLIFYDFNVDFYGGDDS